MSFQPRALSVAGTSGGAVEIDSASNPLPSAAETLDDDHSGSSLELSDAADPSLCNAASPMPGSEVSRDINRDVTPENLLDAWEDVPYDSLENARIATIPYSARFAAVFGLLRVAREREEVSRRALALTSEATRLCAADYSTWSYRCLVVRGLLQATGTGPEGCAEREAILQAEDDFVRRTAARVPKSYQLWEYRRFLFELKRKEVHAVLESGGGDSSAFDALFMQERARVDSALDSDDKNYHAWSHLGWLAREAALPSTERKPPAASDGDDTSRSREDGPLAQPASDEDLIATGARIRKDVRNNSAYAHRWATGRSACQSTNELRWALDRTRLAPRNEAAWNYALALSRRVSVGVAEIVAVAREHLLSDERNVPARRVLVLARGEGSCDKEERISQCRLLATEMDVERYQYWIWKMGSLQGENLPAD